MNKKFMLLGAFALMFGLSSSATEGTVEVDKETTVVDQQDPETGPAADTDDAGIDPAADTNDAGIDPAADTNDAGIDPAADTNDAAIEPAGGNAADAEVKSGLLTKAGAQFKSVFSKAKAWTVDWATNATVDHPKKALAVAVVAGILLDRFAFSAVHVWIDSEEDEEFEG